MIRGIHHIAINTARFDRMRDFYVDVLGLEPVTDEAGWDDAPAIDQIIGLRGSSCRVQLFRAGNCYIELFEYSRPAAREADPLRACDHGYTHFALDVTDIEQEYDRLAKAGMPFMHDRPADFGAIKGLYGQDPDGNIIEIQEIERSHVMALDRLQPSLA